MLQRKITKELLKWKNKSKKALLVTGARQIGKSYAIREFGKENYEVYFEANLLLDKEARASLTTAQNPTDFINRVVLLSHRTLIPGHTLIFIDEIQEYPDIVTMIKGLVEDGRFSYAFSGSMLGTEFKGVTSFPVGFVEHIVMRPMDFEEFCWAIGIQQQYLDDIRLHMQNEQPVEQYLHEIMLKNFRTYVVAGGMPEVVQKYIDNAFTLIETQSLQSELVKQYAQDISKYAGERAFEVRAIFDRIPFELESESKRFNFASLHKGARFETYDHDFLWLVNAGVGIMVLQATEAKSPLKRTEDVARFKLYQSDTGMLVSRYPQSTARAVYLDQKTPNLGGIYENVVAQELAAQGIDSWYFMTQDIGEVDFLIEGTHGHIVPIEVKSGKKTRSHAALDRLLAVREYRINNAVVISHTNIQREGAVLYLPFYTSFCLNQLTEQRESSFTFAPALP